MEGLELIKLMSWTLGAMAPLVAVVFFLGKTRKELTVLVDEMKEHNTTHKDLESRLRNVEINMAHIKGKLSQD